MEIKTYKTDMQQAVVNSFENVFLLWEYSLHQWIDMLILQMWNCIICKMVAFGVCLIMRFSWELLQYALLILRIKYV